MPNFCTKTYFWYIKKRFSSDIYITNEIVILKKSKTISATLITRIHWKANFVPIHATQSIRKGKPNQKARKIENQTTAKPAQKPWYNCVYRSRERKRKTNSPAVQYLSLFSLSLSLSTIPRRSLSPPRRRSRRRHASANEEVGAEGFRSPRRAAAADFSLPTSTTTTTSSSSSSSSVVLTFSSVSPRLAHARRRRAWRVNLAIIWPLPPFSLSLPADASFDFLRAGMRVESVRWSANFSNMRLYTRGAVSVAGFRNANKIFESC